MNTLEAKKPAVRRSAKTSAANIGICLWFNDQAEEAANFYTKLFKRSKITSKAYNGPAVAKMSGQPEGAVLTVSFELMGRKFMALNGGPTFKFNEATSIMIFCDTQEEIDTFWDKLTANGGEESQCGWVKDKFGVSWQICPSAMERMMTSGQDRADRVMEAVMKMKKLDIATMERAFQGELPTNQ